MKRIRRSTRGLVAWAVGLVCAAVIIPTALEAQSVSFAGVETTIPASGVNDPLGLAVDGAGDVFIANYNNANVIELTPGGTQTVVVSRIAPHGVAVDGAGNIFVSDFENGLVVKVAPNGTQTTVITGLSDPGGVAVDAAGDVFVADFFNERVVEVTPSGTQTTVISGLRDATDVAVDPAGDIFVAYVPGNGGAVVEIPAGGGKQTTFFNGTIGTPEGLVADRAGNIFVTDRDNGNLWEIPAGAGSPVLVLGGLSEPDALAVDESGSVYVSEIANNTVVKLQLGSVNFGSANVCPTGQTSPAPCSTPAVSLLFSFHTAGSLGQPSVVTGGGTGLDFADTGTGSCTANGTAHTYSAGDTCTINATFTPTFPGERNGVAVLRSTQGTPIAGAYLYGLGTGPEVAYDPGVKTSPINALYPASVATDNQGNVYVADQTSQTIVKYPSSGSPVTLASGVSASGIGVDGLGDVFYGAYNQNAIFIISANTTVGTQIATVPFPDNSLVVDGSGNLYVPTAENGTIVKITEGTWQVSTIANLSERVIGLAIDPSGNLYAAGFESNTIYKIAAGTFAVSTLTSGGNLNAPDGLAIDAAGNLYASNYNGGVVKIAAGTYAQTLLDSGYQAFGLALDQAGDLYVGNGTAGSVEKFARSSASLTFPSTAVGSTSSSQPVDVSNIGNAPLAVLGLSIANNFAQVDGSGNPQDCTTSLSLATGASCNLSLSFTPTIPGAIQGSAVLSDNALNGNPATQTISLNGTATDVVASFTITGLAGGPAGTGQNFTITALDSKGNVDVNFSGTVGISSSDPQGEGTGSVTLANGVKALSGAWKFLTAGSQTLTVTDSTDSVVSTSAPVLITAGPASSMAIVQGSGQSATVNTAFAAPLQVVVKDQFGNLVSGATVTFTAQSTGASAALSTPAVTAADGTTSVTATANATAGSYNVNVTSTRVSSVRFALTNNLASQTITFPQPISPVIYSPALTLPLTATSTSNLAVTYSVISGPATVSGSTLTITGAGTVVVAANQAGNSTYAAATAVQDAIMVSPAKATITLGNLSQTYSGSALSATATTSPANLPVSFTYNGSATTPTAAGSYAVVATITSGGNYTGTASGTLVISPALATFTLSNLSQTYTGSPLPVTATTNPVGQTFTITYNGSATAPTAAASYTVVATIVSGGNYTGTITGTLVISPAKATITLGSLSQAYSGSALSATATTSPANLPVSFTYNGSATAPTAAGSYAVVATIASGGNYTGTASGTLVISPATATITLVNLTQTYTGSALSATATTNPVGQTVTITYNGSATAPTAAGSYTVVATIASGGNYSGTATGTLVISPATATVTLGNLSQTYTGSALSAIAITNPAGQTVTITYNGSATAPTAAGSYTVVATIASGGNYSGTATGTLVINPATATIKLGNLSQTYTGSPLSATATTSPANLPVSFTYNGSATAPTAVGSYTVVATIASGGNYTGTASGTLVISQAGQSITFGSIAAQVVGNTVNLSATSTSALAVSFASSTPSVCSVSGTTATMLSAGNCTIQASQAGNANYAAASPVSVSFAVTSAAGFKLTATPNSETIHRGILAAFLLEAQSVNGFSGNVNITCSGGPSDSVCGDFPQTLKLLPNKLALAVSGILFPKNTTPGTYTLIFTGTSGSTTVTTTAQFKVED